MGDAFGVGRWKTVVGVLAALLVAALGIAFRRARRFGAEIDGHVADLRSAAASEPGPAVGDADLAALPAPIARYLETVLADGQFDVDEGRPPGRLIRLRQRGEFRLGDRDAPWRPMRATQHVTTDPPGFVWDATIRVAPLAPVRVIDRYAQGEGVLQAALRSAVPVASAGPNPKLNESELTRYLGEAAWYPWVLRPGWGVEWEAIDETAARATLDHRGVTASLVFHVDDDGLLRRVTTERYRQEADDYAPWTGRFRDYATRNGVRVPLEAEVEWNLPDGDLPYWRASVSSIEYLPAGSGGTRR